MTSSDPCRHDRTGGVRTWGRGPDEPGPQAWGGWGWTRAVLAASAFGAVYLAVLYPLFRGALWIFVITIVGAMVHSVVRSLREAYRVTLYPDRTLELVRPIGTARIGVDRVRTVRLSRDSEGDVTTLRVITDRGTYLVWHELGDVRDLADALCERNPGIERRGI